MSDAYPAAAKRPGGWRFLWQLCPPLLLVSFVALAFYNSLQGAFLFDDVYHIVENERIRQWWPPWDLLAVERPVVEWSLAVNYALGGLNPWGYHLFNLVVHILAALTLFGVVRRTFDLATKPRSHEATKGIECATVKERSIGAVGASLRTRSVTGLAPGALFAFAVALLWAAHPLQTQSVTYVIQRGESLMGLFYLLTLYCAIRSLTFTRRLGWYGAAIVTCALGMASKAVMVTAPIMVFVYDFVFLRTGRHALTSGSRGGKSTVRFGLYLGLAATWGMLWACDITGDVFNPGGRQSHVGFGFRGITPLEYAATQPGVILKYLRLALWPVGLCLDYDWSVATTLDVIVLPAVIIVGLLVVTAYLLLQRSWLGFAGAWFFLILAPTSSFIPIKDLAFEHRMYLPLAAVIAAVVFGGRALVNGCLHRLSMNGKIGPRLRSGAGMVLQGFIVIAVGMLLAYGTYQRNEDYHSELAMWSDVAKKRPYNARARVAIGNALLAGSQVDEAIAAYREAVAIRPDFADGHCSLGMGLARKGALDEAVAAYRESLRLDPDHAKAHYNLGNALSRQERTDEAILSFRESLRIEPGFADAHCNLGNSLAALGQLDEAIAEYREALRIKPGLANAHKNLGDGLVQLGRVEEGVAEFREAIRIRPDYANAHANLAAALFDRGETESALQHAQEALRLDPHQPIAQDVLTAASKRGPGSTPDRSNDSLRKVPP